MSDKRKFNWDDAQVFAVAARRGSASAAAAEFGISASTVTRRLTRLERELEATLFLRERDGLRLTRAGKRALECVKTTTQGMDKLRRSVMGDNSRFVGQVTVLLPRSVRDIAMPAIAAMLRRRPQLQVAFACPCGAGTGWAQADCVVLITSEPPLDWVGRAVADFSLGVYANRAADGALGSVPSDWSDWTCQCGTSTRWEQSQSRRCVRVRTEDVEVQQAALRAGVGCGPLPCVMGELDPMLERVPSIPTIVVGQVWVLTPSGLRPVERVRETRAVLTEAIESNRHALAGTSLTLPPSICLQRM